jgi:hypothetical protein
MNTSCVHRSENDWFANEKYDHVRHTSAIDPILQGNDEFRVFIAVQYIRRLTTNGDREDNITTLADLATRRAPIRTPFIESGGAPSFV